MPDKSRERALEGALFALYEQWWKDLGYRAERFRQTIVPGCKRYQGGVKAVQDVLLKRTGGFERLSDHPKITVEWWLQLDRGTICLMDRVARLQGRS